MMETGNLLAADVLPKVAKEMSKVANSGGALEAKLKTTRVQQGRFFKELESSANLIFTSGFDVGLAGLFKSMVEELKGGQTALIGLGQIFKWFFDTITLGVKFFAPILNSVVFVFGEFAQLIDMFNGFIGNAFIGNLLVMAGAFALLFTRLKNVMFIGGMLKMVFSPIILIFGTVLALLDEVFSLFQAGRIGVIEKFLFGGKDIDADLADIKKSVLGLFSDLSSDGTTGGFSEKITRAIVDGIKKAANDASWDEFVNSTIKSYELIVGFLEGLNGKLRDVWDFIKTGMMQFVDLIAGVFDGIFKSFTDKFNFRKAVANLFTDDKPVNKTKTDVTDPLVDYSKMNQYVPTDIATPVQNNFEMFNSTPKPPASNTKSIHLVNSPSVSISLPNNQGTSEADLRAIAEASKKGSMDAMEELVQQSVITQ